MRRLVRPQPPATFVDPNGKRARAQDAMLRAFADDPELRNGTKKYEFNDSIWGDMKSAFFPAQLGTCAFCETAYDAGQGGDVEHFRPKGAWRQGRNTKKQSPSYWWLAYEWTNYWVCCADCNRTFKSDIFPLAQPESRARSPLDSIESEGALLIDPGIDDPRLHLKFDGPFIVPKNGSQRGKITIEVAGLARGRLLARRAEHHSKLDRLIQAWRQAPVGGETRAILSELIVETLDPGFAYSTMARDLISRQAPELITP
jgi:hypothetical protein